MRHLSTLSAVFGCLLLAGLGCAKSEGGGGEGGSSATGGSTGSGGSGSGSGGSTGSGGSSSGGSTGSGGSSSGGSTGTGGNVSTGGTTGTGGAKGGSSGTGGTTGTGGAKGGSTGTGGSSSGGTTGSGGSGSGGTTGTGGSSSTSCTITPTATISSKIGTVGIVTFTTTLSSPTKAQIDFGPDTSYGMTAPVDLTQASYRTLLLGMKPSKAYHYRISVTNASGTCTGSDNTIMTGALLNGLKAPTVTNGNTSAQYGGFIVTGQYAGGGTAPAFIFDKDGAYVWAYQPANSDACGATMSYDGQYMWINNANVPDTAAHVHKVSMDGMTDVDLSTPFAHLSHQITPLPDGSVAFYATGSNGCDDVKIFPANGTASSSATTVVNAKTAHGGTGACHVNNIQYSPSDDTLVFSDLDNNVVTKVTKTGTTVWVLNGGVNGVTDTFNSGAVIWKGGEHGIHVLAVDDFVIFNNNSKNPAGGGNWGSAAGDGSGAQAIEVKLNVSAKTASITWMYKANPALVNDVLGDVQRLPNGNTMVDYATQATIQEVDASGNVVQQIKSSTNFGYLQKRPTLYGPPPR